MVFHHPWNDCNSLLDVHSHVDYAEQWHSEFVLSREFARGRHDQDDVVSFLSVRRAMDAGMQPLSPYSSVVISALQEDLREESKVRHEAVGTLISAAKYIRSAEKVYSEFLDKIDNGSY